MPRQARVVVKNHPHHIVQRGHNRNAAFFDFDDYQYYIQNLRTLKFEYNVKVYGYCLIQNQVHLILDPQNDINSIALLMKRLAGRQTRFTNSKYNRSGTLWESRYKSSIVQTDPFLLACCRFVDLIPVSENLVDHPGEYQWSSYNSRFTKPFSWIDPCPCFSDFGELEELQQKAYLAYVKKPANESEIQTISSALNSNSITGNIDFVNRIARDYDIPVQRRARGRPRKS